MTLILICAIAALILLTIFSEKGELGWSIITFLAFFAVLFFVDKRITFDDTKRFLTENAGYMIASAIVYIMAGVLWALLKWKWYCREIYYNNIRRNNHVLTIHASEHKSRITAWMVWWPLSFGWFIIHDPITKFYNYLYEKLSNVFQNISATEKERLRKLNE